MDNLTKTPAHRRANGPVTPLETCLICLKSAAGIQMSIFFARRTVHVDGLLARHLTVSRAVCACQSVLGGTQGRKVVSRIKPRNRQSPRLLSACRRLELCIFRRTPYIQLAQLPILPIRCRVRTPNPGPTRPIPSSRAPDSELANIDKVGGQQPVNILVEFIERDHVQSAEGGRSLERLSSP
jgi:hypothetical protein